MTVKELIKILRRFPKAANVIVNEATEITIGAQVNQDNDWTVIINSFNISKEDSISPIDFAIKS